MTTSQNALFFQKALPAGARFPLLADYSFEVPPQTLSSDWNAAEDHVDQLAPGQVGFICGKRPRRDVVGNGSDGRHAAGPVEDAARPERSTSRSDFDDEEGVGVEAGVGIEPSQFLIRGNCISSFRLSLLPPSLPPADCTDWHEALSFRSLFLLTARPTSALANAAA